MAVTGSATASAPSTKRSLFSKKPTWAASNNSPATESSAKEIFTHSTSDSLNQLWREREAARRRKEEKERRRAEKAERRKSGETSQAEGTSKRRRISEDDYKRYGLISPEKRAAQNAKSSREGSVEQEDSDVGTAMAPKSREERVKSRSKSREGKPGPDSFEDNSQPKGKPQSGRAKLDVVTLSDDDEDRVSIHTAARKGLSPPPPPPDSDDEFGDLILEAKKRRAQQDAEARALQRQTANKSTTAASLTSTARQPGPVKDAPELDPIIKVFVTSPLTNTKPLLVHRRLSQRFQEIRQVWCGRQGFTAEQTAAVFLTYRMRKIYDVTTCRSLGIKVDSNGRVVLENEKTKDVFAATIRGLDEEDVDENEAEKVHVEAFTEEAFQEVKKRRAAEKAGQIRNATAVNDTTVDPADEAVPSMEDKGGDEKKIRIYLRSRGFKDYKLIVRPTTTFGKIMQAFRKENKISPDSEVVLLFDGERLEPEDEIQVTEIEDMDSIEAHLR